MSIRLMCAAFDAEVPATQKLVLLALCDNANDQGQCFPSVALLERKCSLSDRAVQNAIAWLEEQGYLSRTFRTGRATLYVITPERGSPPNDVHPRTTFTPPPNVVHPTPEPRSPITIKEPSKNRKKISAIERPDEVTEQTWNDYLQLRKQKRADLTLTALDALKREARKAGWSLEAVLRECIVRGWTGFKAEWIDKPSSKKESDKFWDRVNGLTTEVNHGNALLPQDSVPF
jgi:hypothetical protein